MVLVPTTNLACYRYVANKGDGLLYAIIIGRIHYRSKSVEILAIKIQVLPASNYQFYTLFFQSLSHILTMECIGTLLDMFWHPLALIAVQDNAWLTAYHAAASTLGALITALRIVTPSSLTAHLVHVSIYSNGTDLFIFILAGGCNGSEIRLYRNSTNSGGMLQMCYQGRWTAVCDYSWGCAESIVACRQLGYTNAGKQWSVF